MFAGGRAGVTTAVKQSRRSAVASGAPDSVVLTLGHRGNGGCVKVSPPVFILSRALFKM